VKRLARFAARGISLKSIPKFAVAPCPKGMRRKTEFAALGAHALRRSVFRPRQHRVSFRDRF